MLSSLVQAFKVPELRNKILFTLGILVLYRFGAYLPVPGIPFQAFADSFSQQGVSMVMLDLFTGGALSNFSVFALGIMPYITASIIIKDEKKGGMLGNELVTFSSSSLRLMVLFLAPLFPRSSLTSW